MKSSVLNWRFGLALCAAFFIFAAGSLFAQAQESSDDELLITADLLLPKSTCAYVSVRDIEVLRRRNGGKVVVTAGIVEGGKEQFAFNRELGNKLSEVSDFVYITGINAKAIMLGLREKGFEDERIFLVRTPQEASEKMQGHLRKGDTVLFLNDLTDNFV